MTRIERAQQEIDEAGHMLGVVWNQLHDRAFDVARTTSWIGYLLSVLLGAIGAFWAEAWGFLTFLLVATMVADWLLGRWRAHRAQEYDRDIAIAGIVTKATGYGVISVLWLVERRVFETLGVFGEGDGGGLMATALLALFLLDELDSVEQNRIRLGGRPVPLWTPAIRALQGAASRLIPGGTVAEAPPDPPPDPE